MDHADNNGDTALSDATSRGHDSIVALLKEVRMMVVGKKGKKKAKVRKTRKVIKKVGKKGKKEKRVAMVATIQKNCHLP